ncbi:hypothetical protein [Actinocorallia herbida]|nr:hypothetical protein [Actinocorallia herbida]
MSIERGSSGGRRAAAFLAVALPVSAVLTGGAPSAVAAESDTVRRLVHYRFQDAAGRCLTKSAFFGKAAIAACDGSISQIWEIECNAATGTPCTSVLNISAFNPDGPDRCLRRADATAQVPTVTSCRFWSWRTEWSPDFNRLLLVNLDGPGNVPAYLGAASLSGVLSYATFSEIPGEAHQWRALAAS